MNNVSIHLWLQKIYEKGPKKIRRIYSSYKYRTKARLRVLFRRNRELAYWWDRWPNFGDRFTPYLIEKKYGSKCVNVRGCSKDFGPAIVGSGSILSGLQYPNNVVWGAGFINEDTAVTSLKPGLVLAYRGPDSERLAVSNGWPKVEVYGDPGLLASRYIPASPKKYKIGIVPHYAHKAHFANELLGGNVLIIDVERDLEEVVKKISSCERVISSSLHGLIVAHSYGIPWIWMKLSSVPLRERGDVDFKYKDFMRSVGVQSPPLVVKDANGLKRIVDSLEEIYVFPDEDQTSGIQDRLDSALDGYFAEGLKKPAPERVHVQ